MKTKTIGILTPSVRVFRSCIMDFERDNAESIKGITNNHGGQFTIEMELESIKMIWISRIWDVHGRTFNDLLYAYGWSKLDGKIVAHAELRTRRNETNTKNR